VADRPAPLRIAVDADKLTRFPARGTQRTTIGLYRALAARRPDWEFLFFHQVGPWQDWFADRPNIRSVQVDMPGDRFRGTLNLWLQVRLPLAVRASRAHVLHCPFGTAPRFAGAPKVATIHDLTPMDFAPTRPDVVRWLANIRSAARTSAAIVTPSEYAKDQVVTRLAVSPERVHVIGWAPADQYVSGIPAERVDTTRAALGLPATRPYLLNFGSGNPHKNTARLLDAWSRQPARVRDAYLLVISGVEAGALEGVRQRVRALQLETSCTVLGSIADEHMPVLVTGATVMLYPSLAEGFGLPIVDAFRVGTPVLTSRVTSMKEVAGDAAWLVDPTSTDAIAAGITRLADDAGLRESLIAAGTARAALFTWERCADAHARLFSDVVRP
jgi:glycosyltransferase involved in cell wall biosynthesis